MKIADKIMKDVAEEGTKRAILEGWIEPELSKWLLKQVQLRTIITILREFEEVSCFNCPQGDYDCDNHRIELHRKLRKRWLDE